MATKEWAIKQYGKVKLNGRDHYLEDGDTWLDVETNKPFRGKGFDTSEVYHEGTEEDPFKAPQTFEGYAQTQIVADLMNEKGFNKQEEDGTGYYGRTLGVVSNPETEVEMANKMYTEGLVAPTPFTSSEDLDSLYSGMATRSVLGEEAEQGYYGDKREVLDAIRSTNLDYYGNKTTALNEKEFANAPWMYNDVMYRDFANRTIDNKARSPFASGFSSGIDSMQEGFWGVVEMTGNRFGSEWLEDVGTEGVGRNQISMENQPTWINDVANVNSLSDFSDWAAGALGGSLPYFMLIAAGFIPGMTLPVGASMALTYGGQTWNEMGGSNDKKSATIALATGVAMSIFERLGGKAVLKGLEPTDLLDEKGIAKAIDRLTAPRRDPKTGKMLKQKLTRKEANKLIAESKEIELKGILKQFGENKAIWNSYLKNVGKGVGKGFLGESATEALQEGTQYSGAYLGSEEGKGEWDTDKLQSRLTNAALAGGLLGGGIGGGTQALMHSSPVHTGVRQAAWERMVAEDFDESKPLDMHEILDTAGEAHVEKGVTTAVGEDGKPTIQYTSNAESNEEHVSKLRGKHDDNKAKKSTIGRTGEIITAFEWISSRYNVVKSKLGDAFESSETLMAEFDFSGFIDNRVAHGLKLPQLKRKLEGIQHAGLHNTTQGLARRLGLNNSPKSRSEAYDLLRKYLKQKQAGKVDKDLLENEVAFENALKGILAIESQVFDWTRRAEGDRSSYNPLDYHTLTEKHLSIKKVVEEKSKFIDILMNDYKYSRKEAEEEFNDLERTPEGYDHKSYAQTEFLTRKPTLLKNTMDYSNGVWESFWEPNSYEEVKVRATEVANYVADTTSMGFGGEKLNSKIIQIEKELTEARGKEFADEHMPLIASSIYDQYKAHRGEFHKIESDKARTAASNAGALMSLAYMAQAVFASLPELGLAFLQADRQQVLSSISKMTKVSGQAIAKQMNRVADTDLTHDEYEKGLNVLRRRGMLTHEYASGHVVDAEYDTNGRKNWMQQTMMPAFYKLTGLTSFTSAMRIIRDGIGSDFVAVQLATLYDVIDKRIENPGYEMNNKEARAFTKMKELGVDPLDIAQRFRDIKENWKANKLMANEILLAHAKNGNLTEEQVAQQQRTAGLELEDFIFNNTHPEVQRMANDLDLARSNFVDAALVNPDPGKRPLFYSDGRYRLLTLFQGYLSVFSATIIKPILKDMAGNGSPKDQMNAAAVALTTIGLGFLGQAIKDEIKYGDSPSWLSDTEYLQRGVMASGLMGQTERIFNLFFPIYHSEEDTLADKAWGEVGPLTGTIDSIQKGIHWTTEGETERALNKFLKVSPIGSFTQQRKWVAEAIAGED